VLLNAQIRYRHYEAKAFGENWAQVQFTSLQLSSVGTVLISNPIKEVFGST
jgi:hypothetical protein